MKFVLNCLIIFSFLHMFGSETFESSKLSLIVCCGFLFIRMVLIPQIEWKRKKQQKRGSS